MDKKNKRSLAAKKPLRTAGAVKRKKAAKPEPAFAVREVFPCCGPRIGSDKACNGICGGKVEGVYLGKYHNYAASLLRVGKNKAQLATGCRRFATAAKAKAHWLSRIGTTRPNAPELIAKARAAAKAVGWKWGA